MNKADQQSFIIHQHHLSVLSQIRLEAEGWDSEDLEVEAYRNKGDFEARFWRFYNPAMKVVANGLDGVFEAGNGYGKFADQVERIGKAYSCSVGDVIQLGGLYWIVKVSGFGEVSDLVKEGKDIIELLAECNRIREDV